MRVELPDGSRVVIRPIEPGDREALAEGFERLSPESRYRRFFAPVAHLSDADLDHLTRVDRHDHEALVAVAEETGEGIGVARYVRIGPDVAEPAIVVTDDWQRRGVGTALLEALVERAQEEGIRRFEASVLAYNADAIHLVERLGATTREPHGPEVILNIDLPALRGPARIRLLLSNFATGVLEPGRTLLEWLWPRRIGAPGDPVRNVIVVGTDGSDHAAAAVEVAAELAAATQASVEVVGVHGGHPDVEAAVREAAGGMRERRIEVHEHLLRGEPAFVLAHFAAQERARLIVVGAGEHGKLARRLIGGVADRIAERAPCNVMIVRPRLG